MNERSFNEFVQDQLAELRAVSCRPMFGGFGLYAGALFFGIIYKGRLYFKTDAATRPMYVSMGMKPFRPTPGQTLKSYYEVPADVLEDREQLTAWARRALKVRPDRERLATGRTGATRAPGKRKIRKAR